MKITFIGVGGITGSYRQSLKQLERPITAVRGKRRIFPTTGD